MKHDKKDIRGNVAIVVCDNSDWRWRTMELGILLYSQLLVKQLRLNFWCAIAAMNIWVCTPVQEQVSMRDRIPEHVFNLELKLLLRPILRQYYTLMCSGLLWRPPIYIKIVSRHLGVGRPPLGFWGTILQKEGLLEVSHYHYYHDV